MECSDVRAWKQDGSRVEAESDVIGGVFASSRAVASGEIIM